MKQQPSEWEIISANEAIDKGLISKIHKQIMHLNKNNKNNQKMDRRPKETFLQRRHTDGKKMRRCSISLTIREMQIKGFYFLRLLFLVDLSFLCQ